ncbi:L,D-transpeptidase family protein [Myxococcus stipitatus]|uniref:L,D-transpeptidase family protein n=1 Tax=Myxococcus stipitatus TaxID=83455 RepID=UPI0031452B99
MRLSLTRVAAVVGALLALSAHAEDRVATARKQRMKDVTALFAAAGTPWPTEQLYVRAFKHERELEVWAGPKDGPLVKVRTYPFCAASGELGPKRRQGDLQVPEGFYTLDLFNPWSNYHLSIRVSYPNAADRHHQKPGVPLGGDIFVHGDCVSIGCIAIQDGPIEELYLMALDTRARTKRDAPIHIFPRRLDAAGMAALEKEAGSDAERLALWKSLQPAYTLFEESPRVPRTSINARTGAYEVKPAVKAGRATR